MHEIGMASSQDFVLVWYDFLGLSDMDWSVVRPTYTNLNICLNEVGTRHCRTSAGLLG
jgi:hypothetical protein